MLMVEAAKAVAVANALDRQEMFGFGTIRPDRFPPNSYQIWVDWRKHFAWVAEVENPYSLCSGVFVINITKTPEC